MPENIKDTENSVFTQNDELYGKKLKSVPKPPRKIDIDTEGELYQNIIEAGMASQLDIYSLSNLNMSAENRNQMYNMYDVMCDDGSISGVIEAYAEDSTERNDNGNIVWVRSSNPDVAKYVEYLLDTLNVDKNIYKWVYSLCKYGDLYLRLYRESDYEDELFNKEEIDKKQTLNESKKLEEDVNIVAYSKNDNYVHYMEMVSNPATMFELTKFGKTVGYVEAPVNSATVMKQDNTTFNTNTFKYNFKRDDITLYGATEFVHAALEDDIGREDEIVNIFLDNEDYENKTNAKSYKVKKGQSLLSGVYKVWKILNLLENSVLLYRVTKSSITRLINVEVGDMPKENVAKTLLGVKNMIEQKTAINTGIGMNEYTNPGPLENNVYVPTHNQIGSITTSQVGGDVDVKSLADLDYFMNKLYGQLRVPKQFFNQTDDSTGFNGGTSLSIISSPYAKMIKRIQNTIIQALTDAINLMLLDKQLDSYVNDFTLHMLPPTTQEEIDRRDNLSTKIRLDSDIMDMLSDIEDPMNKLKILKALLSQTLDDSEILDIIQEEIDNLEEEANQEEMIPEEDEEDLGILDREEPTTGGGGLNRVLGGEGPEQNANEPTQSSNQELGNETGGVESEAPAETNLPNPSELGIDLTNM